MDFTHLEYFKLLAKFEHMTHTANALHIAQPALSRALRKMEQYFGLPLFDRVGKHIRLNDNGKTLLAYVDRILLEMEEARVVLADRQEQAKRQVSISMYAATQLLPEIIGGFRKMYPDISLLITQQGAGTEKPAHECDIVVHSASQPMNKKNCVTLMKEEICLMLPVTHPLSTQSEVSLIQVAGAPFIGLHKGSGLRTVTDEYCQKAGFLPNVVLESDSPAIVRDLIALGVGLAFIPKISWSGMDYGPNVSLVNIKDPHCVRYVYMTWRENWYVSKASKLFQQHLIDFFKEKQT